MEGLSMKSMNNLDRLGFDWRGDWPMDQHQNLILPSSLIKWFESLRKATAFKHYYIVDCYGEMRIYTHGGIPSSATTPELPMKIFDQIHHHYFDKWYEPDGDDGPGMTKVQGNEKFAWYKMFSMSFWLCLTHDKHDLITQLADWTESWFEREWYPLPVDPLWAKTFLSIASDFRTKPLEGRDEMEEAIRKSLKKGPKLLLAAWNAARGGDQQKFEKALLESTKHSISTLYAEKLHIYDYILFGQSTLLAAARRLGLKVPDFGADIMAHIPTSESMGLPEPSAK